MYRLVKSPAKRQYYIVYIRLDVSPSIVHPPPPETYYIYNNITNTIISSARGFPPFWHWRAHLKCDCNIRVPLTPNMCKGANRFMRSLSLSPPILLRYPSIQSHSPPPAYPLTAILTLFLGFSYTCVTFFFWFHKYTHTTYILSIWLTKQIHHADVSNRVLLLIFFKNCFYKKLFFTLVYKTADCIIFKQFKTLYG